MLLKQQSKGGMCPSYLMGAHDWALVIVVRFVDEGKDGDGRPEWTINQRLVKLNVLAKSLTEEQLAQQLILTLATHLQVAPAQLIAGMRDGASVNGAVMRLKASTYFDYH